MSCCIFLCVNTQFLWKRLKTENQEPVSLSSDSPWEQRSCPFGWVQHLEHKSMDQVGSSTCKKKSQLVLKQRAASQGSKHFPFIICAKGLKCEGCKNGNWSS